jgi:hypothetical protein
MKLLAMFLVAPLALPSSAPEDPCLAPGECITICFARPPLGQPGDPADAEWIGGGSGKPKGLEDDVLSDDELGDASGIDPACIEICNDGGNLEGPNGDDQNEGTEGDTIEVKVCWTYRYRETVTTGSSTSTTTGISINGGSTQTGHTTSVTRAKTVWKWGKKCSTPTNVTACE